MDCSPPGSFVRGFPGSSADKESACNAGDPGLIPGSGIYPGEGIGYPLQYSWTSLVAQLVKNLPTMQETRFNSWVARSPGKVIGYPVQFSWTSLVAQLVKNLPAMRETWVWIPGLGRSPGEGKGYPLQYSWTSLVAHLVKNLPAMQETWVRSLG